jgi:hypothetical protein
MFWKEGKNEEAGNEGLMDLKFLACVGGFHIPDMIRPSPGQNLLFF